MNCSLLFLREMTIGRMNEVVEGRVRVIQKYSHAKKGNTFSFFMKKYYTEYVKISKKELN